MPGIDGNTPQAYLNGSWKNWEAVSGNIAGTWRTASDVYQNHNGTWKHVWVRLTGPTNGSTSLSDVTATISWTPGVGQEGFKLYRNGSFVKNVAANATSTTDALPALNTNYTYTVSAYAGSTETAQIPCGNQVGNFIAQQGVSVNIYRDWGYSNSTWDGQQILFSTDCINFGTLYGYEYSLNNGASVAGSGSAQSAIFGMNQDWEYNVRWRLYRDYNGTRFYGAWSSTVNVKAGRPLIRNAQQNVDYNKTVRFDQTVGETVDFGAFGTVVDSYQFRNVDAVGSSLLANSNRRVTFHRPAGAGGNIVIPYGSSSTTGTGDDNGNYIQGPFTNYVAGFYGVQTFGSWSVASTPYVTYTLRFTVRSIAQGPAGYSIALV